MIHSRKIAYATSTLTTLVLAFSISGCSHGSQNQRIDQEVSQEGAIKSRADLNNETSTLIKTAPGLTDDERAKLSALRDSTKAQVDQLGLESLKLRAVLIKDLVSTNYNEDEVELIKKRLKKIENDRLSAIFKAVEQANVILGHSVPDSRSRIMDDFFEGHSRSSD